MPRTQEDRSRSTRNALLAAGRRLFAERGYAQVSADEIVAAAGLTRGALHHHYKDKQGLFLAVFEQIEQELRAEIAASIEAAPDVPGRMAAGLTSFLDVCQRPEILRIGLLDAPTVLGWETWRAIESEHAFGLIVDLLDKAAADGLLKQPPSAVLARFILSAVIEAALMIAHETATRAEVEASLGAMLTGVFSG
ncbi:TetR/AcrR family transcriptional regulator [Actinocrispum wychmicini]|uniref:TetR family transcriptional regulator n=1 Tax=Actinocrispum wychmicini TaxID=1213861 RepID=A0A4R2JVE3_9PSEU|nr:TetR/AcrR family transcriptional regulator [Actinocrispum wychmicini]TCO58125.1 TetR family transcriptional regulator [Actinocrispum wychmicini]